MFENPRRGRQARNFTTNVPKILDLKSPSEQIFSENCRWVPLTNARKICFSDAHFPSARLYAWPLLQEYVSGHFLLIGKQGKWTEVKLRMIVKRGKEQEEFDYMVTVD